MLTASVIAGIRASAARASIHPSPAPTHRATARGGTSAARVVSAMPPT